MTKFSILHFAILGCISMQIHAQSQPKNQEDHNILNEISITGSGYEQKIKNTPATISVLTQKDIQKKAYRDITDALKDVPGVIITGGGSSSDISIRGASSAYTLILIDGKRVNSRETRPNSDGSGIEQGWMPPISSIKRIEVIKGPMSSLYGSDAMGGVINIITHKPSTRGWYGSLASDITVQENRLAGNQYQGNASIAGPLVKGLLGIKASGVYSEREEDRIVKGYNQQKIKGGNIELNGQIGDNDNLTLGYNYSRQDRIGNPGLSLAENSKPNINNYDRDSWTLTHDGDYKKAKTSNYIQMDRTENPGRSMEYKSLIVNSMTSFDWYNHKITAGGEYRKEDLEDLGNQLDSPGKEALTKLDRWNLSFFAEGNWSLLPRLNVVTGARLEKDENYGTQVTPRGYLIWNATDNLTLKGGVSSGYKAPSLRQSAPGWGQITGGANAPVPGIILGNADLKPETSFNQEITAMWDSGTGVNASVTFYHTSFKDKISTQRELPPNGQSTIEHQGKDYAFIERRINLDAAKMLGMEVTLNWNFSPSLRIKNSYTFTETEITSGAGTGYAMSNVPKHIVVSTFEFDLNQTVQLWTRMNFQGKTPNTWGRSSAVNGNPDFGLWDFGSVFKVTKQLSLTAGAYNLLDKSVTNEDYNFRLDGRRYQFGAIFNF